MNQTLSTLAALAFVTIFALPSIALAGPSEADKEKARVNFQEADGNDDTKLDRAEFEAFIRANAKDGIGKAPKVVRSGAFDRAFATMDANSDGFVSAEEVGGKK